MTGSFREAHIGVRVSALFAATATMVHSRLPDRNTMLNVGAGWHMHLDILAARLTGGTPAPFLDGWAQLKSEYDVRLPV
jgi:hypothetical protein